MRLPSTSVNREERDHSSLQERTGPAPAAPLLMNNYVRCAHYPWHASRHGFLQKWPPRRRRGPPYSIVCTRYCEANSENLTNNNKVLETARGAGGWDGFQQRG